MKTVTLFRKALLVGLASMVLVSCGKEEPDSGITNEPEKEEQQKPNPDDKDDPEAEEYEITLESESKFYEVDFPETAKEGETVTVTVTPVENVTIVGVRYNSKKAEAIAENVYSFEMPKKDVKLKIESSSTITVVPSSYYAYELDKEVAEAGDMVTVVFGVYNIEDQIIGATVNGTTKCKLEGTDLGVWIYSFTMPEGPAVVEAQLADEYFVIEREWDDHSVVYMLDCINNQGTADEFCSQKTGFPVHFLYKWDLGYDAICTVTGKETGKDYTGEVFWSLAADNHLYQDCWAFLMPDEPVVIKTVSTERNTYEGAEFVGQYTGYWITADGNNLIYSSAQPAMNLELRKSSAFFVKTTDSNAYDFSGIYSVDNGRIASDREEARGDFALRGEVLENGYAFAIVDNILYDNVDNRRFYLAGKNNFEFVCASDKYATRFLLEANEGGQKSWYFIERDNQSIKKALVSFTSGSSIGETCEAMVTVEGGIAFNRTEVFKYTYQNGSNPVFTYIGKEAGTYTSAKGETLVLDGFGNGTYNGVEGTYTLADGIVTFTDRNGKETKMNTDVNNKTFTVVTDASEGTLSSFADYYYTSTAKISVDGNVSQTGIVEFKIDSDYNGNYKKGSALIGVFYIDTGKQVEMTKTSRAYSIDEANRTITISGVLQGCIGPNGNWSTERKDVVLKYSEDFKTLTIVNDKITATSSPYIYCIGGEDSLIPAAE
jgi:hypothetical protein